jgi:hypothetical protein
MILKLGMQLAMSVSGKRQIKAMDRVSEASWFSRAPDLITDRPY